MEFKNEGGVLYFDKITKHTKHFYSLKKNRKLKLNYNNHKKIDSKLCVSEHNSVSKNDSCFTHL
jgi:hypothetical protein